MNEPASDEMIEELRRHWAKATSTCPAGTRYPVDQWERETDAAIKRIWTSLPALLSRIEAESAKVKVLKEALREIENGTIGARRVARKALEESK